jgi:hypothetical protein
MKTLRSRRLTITTDIISCYEDVRMTLDDFSTFLYTILGYYFGPYITTFSPFCDMNLFHVLKTE